MADDLLNQGDIEQLLRQSASAPAESQAAGVAPARDASASAPAESGAATVMAPGEGASASVAGSAASAGDSVAQPDLAKPAKSTGAESARARRGQGAPEAAVGAAVADAPGEQDAITKDDIDYLLKQAEQALASIDSEASGEPPLGMTAFRLETFNGAPPSTDTATLDLLRDVNLDVRIELGRTHMYLEDVLRLRKGSVVPLDKLAGDPVDIFVNGRLIARGEVLVLNDNFCVRVAELIAGVPVEGS